MGGFAISAPGYNTFNGIGPFAVLKDELGLILSLAFFHASVFQDKAGQFQGAFWPSPATVLDVAVRLLCYGDGKL